MAELPVDTGADRLARVATAPTASSPRGSPCGGREPRCRFGAGIVLVRGRVAGVEDHDNDDPSDRAVDLRLATGLVSLVERARNRLGGDGNRLARTITDHLGCALAAVPNITTTFPGWEHLNVQRAMTAYLALHDPDARWFGITGRQTAAQDLMDVLTAAEQNGTFERGAPSYATVADGPNSATEVVQLGLVCTRAPGGDPVVIGVRGPGVNVPKPTGEIRVLATSTATATLVRATIEDLMREHDAYLGQILQFDVGEHRGNELVTFLPRPTLAAADVILPPGVLAAIEDHVVRATIAPDRLRAAGQHLKRGVLLYGPPGTGKTHTVRYLMSRLIGHTIVILSGRALNMLLPAAVALARRAQPSVVVIEDVDLIAEGRSIGPGSSNPMLFELLNRIDGIDGDADIVFLLTTNRVDALERALSERPGRVDLAVEIAKPDRDARLRLLRLYSRSLSVELPEETTLADATDGVTASYIRELVRRAVIAELPHIADDAQIVITEQHLLEAHAQLSSQSQALTRSILGGPA